MANMGCKGVDERNLVLEFGGWVTDADYLGYVQRLSAKDIDNWEQKRVKRLPGEHDGIL